VSLCCAFLLLAFCSPAQFEGWRKIHSPVSDHLHNAFFIDEEWGWIISYGTGLILHTDDGGDRWRVQARLEPLFYESLYFVDKKRGWLCGERGKVLRTRDGGRTWLDGEVKRDDIAFYGIYFYNDRRGFAVGFDVNNRHAVFFESHDGGARWEERSESFPGTGYESIQFVDDSFGFIGGGRHVLTTSDGGETWSAHDVGVEAVIRGIHFLDRNIGWAVGHDGLVLRSSDGGKIWEKQESFTKNRLRSVHFVTRKEGFIVGDEDKEEGTLWQTLDGGRTWKRVAGTYPDLHRLVRSPEALWIVGKSGTVLSQRTRS